jgi:serine/threonine-protein kinase RsbW
MCFAAMDDSSSVAGTWQQERLREVCHAASLIGRVCDAIKAVGYTSEDLFAIRIALDEAIANALIHGNRRDSTKEVKVWYRISPNRVVATIEDEGEGFDPAKIPDPLSPDGQEKASGRGILLMRHYSTSVRFNRIGNCVTLCRRRTRGQSEADR